MVPATISVIEDWKPLIRFLGLRYRTLFFEMPGHGGSSALEGGFDSRRLPGVIAELADHAGIDRFILLSFSFGGILALRALKALGPRVVSVILLSPCVAGRALQRSTLDRALITALTSTLEHRLPRRGLAALMRNERAVRLLAWFMCDVGGFETSADLPARLASYSMTTIDVLATQIREVLTLGDDELDGPYPQPCLFAMSVSDPLLSYTVTEAFVRKNFTHVMIETFDWPYHAPPVPFSLDDYIRDYGWIHEMDLAVMKDPGIRGYVGSDVPSSAL